MCEGQGGFRKREGVIVRGDGEEGTYEKRGMRGVRERWRGVVCCSGIVKFRGSVWLVLIY